HTPSISLQPSMAVAKWSGRFTTVSIMRAFGANGFVLCPSCWSTSRRSTGHGTPGCHEGHLPRLRRRPELVGMVGAPAAAHQGSTLVPAGPGSDRTPEPARRTHGSARGDLLLVEDHRRDEAGGDAVRVRIHRRHHRANPAQRNAARS